MKRWTVLPLAVLVVAAGFLLFRPAETKRVTAYFDRVVGLYPGSDVRILGVKVGQVASVTPMGDRVRVAFAYDAGIKVPAAAEAVVVARTVVADRYVQLSPPYTSGPVLADGATLARGRSPVEIDEALGAFDELAKALGPQGANANGALSRLLKVSARTFGGEGATVGATLREVSDAAGVLAASKEDISGTVRNLAVVTGALSREDRRVRDFVGRLARVSGQLNDERAELRGTLRGLAGALDQVTGFVTENRGEITTNVRDLARLARLLVEHRASIETFLDTAPLAINNASRAYDAETGAFRMRFNLNGQTDDFAMWACSLAYSLGVPPSGCESLLKVLNPVAKQLNAVELDTSSGLTAGTDLTLGGLLPAPSPRAGIR